jgi:hypothetical protein
MIAMDGDISLSLPTDFLPVPLVDELAEARGVVAELQLDDRLTERLTAALRSVRGSVGEASAWALVRKPTSGLVDAVLTLVIHVTEASDSPKSYLENLALVVPAEIVNRISELRIIAGRPAAVVHDFAVPGGGDKPALERAYAAVFLSEIVMFEFGLLTQDMHLFEDASAYLVEILEAGLTWRHDG